MIVTDKTAFAWPVVVLAVVVGIAIAGGVASAQDGKTANAKQDSEVRALQVDAALNAEQHRAILDALKEIKSDLKELKASVKK